MGIIDNSIIKIQIDGIEFSAKRGAKIIEIADEAGIYIPRFCYHKKLSIAANCRMCLVEVEKAPKLFPACATPITDGMKIFTNTEKVISAQRAVMEFLLINHPLDCPICDQGGECELQDLTVGYGCSTSRFSEDKRSFMDYDMGPLVSTDVTRCILCSRCVRFCSEISGTDDLGIIGRGSNSRIFTFLKSHLKSGLSGNVIDLCPVGSLTAKPSKFKVRPWELIQKSFISYHDCIGSNLYIHVNKEKVIRIVPKRNESLNETWISDRDRFSYEGLYSSDRLTSPMFKENNVWREISWDNAFKIISNNIKDIISNFGSNQLGAIASPNSTCEEFYILQKILRALGSNNLDHRLNQIDFSYQDKMPLFPGLNINLDEIDKLDSVLIIGSDIIKEQPILGIKLRKIVNNGGNIFVINPIDFEFFMNISNKYISNPKNFIYILSCIIKNIILSNNILVKDNFILDLISKLPEYEKYNEFSNKFFISKRKLILIGSYVVHGPDYYKILSLSIFLSKITESYLGIITDGANSSGAFLTGFIPHRLAGGNNIKDNIGMNFSEMFSNYLKCYILFGVEIENDSIYSKNIINALKKSDFVISFSSFKSTTLLEVSNIILPIASSYENSGTFINISGIWQSFESVVLPDFNVKLGWKTLIDLSNYLKLPGFNYPDISFISSEIQSLFNEKYYLNWDVIEIDDLNSQINDGLIVIPYISQYNSDSLVRRAKSLQKLNDDLVINSDYLLRCNQKTFNKFNFDNLSGTFTKNNLNKKWVIEIDNAISDDVLFIRNYNFTSYLDFCFLYDLFSFEKI